MATRRRLYYVAFLRFYHIQVCVGYIPDSDLSRSPLPWKNKTKFARYESSRSIDRMCTSVVISTPTAGANFHQTFIPPIICRITRLAIPAFTNNLHRFHLALWLNVTRSVTRARAQGKGEFCRNDICFQISTSFIS